MQFRPAEKQDAANVLAFYEALTEKLASTDYYLPWRVGVYPTADLFDVAIANGQLHLCTEGETIVGAAILNRTQGDGYETIRWQCEPDAQQIGVIHLLCTDPDLHGKGIGRQLVDHLIEEAGRTGIRSLRLDVLHSNKPAIKLYERSGFQRQGEVQLCYATTGLTVFYLYELVL